MYIFNEKYQVRGAQGFYQIYDRVYELYVPGISYSLMYDRLAFNMAVEKCREMNLEYSDRLMYLEEIKDFASPPSLIGLLFV